MNVTLIKKYHNGVKSLKKGTTMNVTQTKALELEKA
jgi:hypothetical protein